MDGFRFDLASALARELHEVDRLSAFFDVIHQDPVISQVKLIAEPWDLGEGGYQVGNFPAGWAEWNGKIPRHHPPLLEGRRRPGRPSSAYRLTGSSDLYEADGRRPSRQHQLRHRPRRLHPRTTWSATTRSTTRPTARTTATAPTTTSSWNCGVEGPTDDPAIRRAPRAPEAQLPRHAAALPGRADALRRRRDGPHPAAATTTPTARTTRSPGSTGPVSPGRAQLLEFTRRLDPPAPRPPGLPPAALLPGPPHRRARQVKDLVVVPARRQGDDRGRVDRRVRPRAWGSGWPATPSRRSTRRASRSRTTPSCCCSTPTTSRCAFVLPADTGPASWELVLDTPATGHPAAGPRGAATAYPAGSGRSAWPLAPAAGLPDAPVTGSTRDPAGATYRLQLRAGFVVRQAADLAPYLADLGVTDVYLSPILRPRAGSTHGYDVVDHGRLNPELGGEAGVPPAGRGPARQHGLGRLLDIVPNHMGIAVGRQRLVAGRAGARPGLALCRLLRHRLVAAASPSCTNRVLLPILGDQYGRVLERRAAARTTPRAPSRSATATTVLPHRPAHLPDDPGRAARRAGAAAGADDPRRRSWPPSWRQLERLPPARRGRPGPPRRADPRKEVKRRLPR